MRSGDFVTLAAVFAAPLVLSAVAHADPPLEASGFVGIGFFGDTVQLGDSWAPEQVPGNGALFGLRLTYLAAPHLADVDANRRFQFALELETEMAASSTRSSPTRDGRMTYFAPVFGWRGQVMFRYVDDAVPIRPHLIFGAGGATVASESPFMRKESDPVVFSGAGISLPLTPTWQVRIDARYGVMAGRGGGIANMAELQIGIGGSFGFPEKRTKPAPVEPLPTQPDVDETDSDHDGLPDHIDRCPAERETVNGLDDDDGCPEPDADADSIVGDADKCPTVPEDMDGFQDDDGCPEADNDADGVLDAADKCPLEPEKRNGFDDDDGCPDTVPPEISKLLATASAIKFESNRARVTDAGQKALAPVLDLLRTRKALRVAITARPTNAKGTELAKRRADAVKWFLIDQGIAEERFQTRLAEPGKGTAVELTLILD